VVTELVEVWSLSLSKCGHWACRSVVTELVDRNVGYS